VLKSHWVDHARGDALDGLAGIFGVERRRLSDGTLEPDEGFRRRLKGIVPYFTGGGTTRAVAGAVRAALGLPYDLAAFGREIAVPGDPNRWDALLRGLADLVRVEEFSPRPERVLSPPPTYTATVSEVTVEVGFSSVMEVRPRIEWSFTRGGGRYLTLQRLDTGEGVRSDDTFFVPQGQTLVLTAGSDGALRASIGLTDVSARFTAWNGASPPVLPAVPGHPTQWKLTARGGSWDRSAFDASDGFDFPDFGVRFEWTRFQPLTFDVVVPYFLRNAVADLQQATGFTGRLFLFEGLPLETIQAVVDQTRAAGVRGMVHFSLSFAEDHAQREAMTGEVRHALSERHDQSESLVVGNVSTLYESQPMDEAFALGGVWDLSTFDGSFGFQ
jgi:hypothetical protein